MPIIAVSRPEVARNLTDGEFCGLAPGEQTPQGSFCGYPSSRNYYDVPPVSIRAIAGQGGASVNKLIVYTNGINTDRAGHAYTVKLLSLITGAKVVGIYNQSGDGEDTNMFADLIQCLGDKTGLGNNPATNTLARSAFRACTNSIYLNVVAHSQGAIITSRAMRQAIGMLLDYYGRRDSTVRPLLEEADNIRNTNIWRRALTNMVNPSRETAILIRLNRALEERIKPLVERKLDSFVSIQTFGGAARFYPNGPRYRHVYNFWDPVPNLVGQGDIMTGPGRGARVERIDRNSGSRIRDFVEDHSITDLYLQPSNNYIDRNGRQVDTNYIPIDMLMIR